MNRTAAICKLYEIADYRLLGSGDWPAEGESLQVFFNMTRDFGLDEDVQDGLGSRRSTPLGIELRVDLMTAFAGCWELYEIPYILERNGYMESSEVDELYELPEPDFEQRLHSMVYRAYREFCGHSKWLN